MTAGPSAAGRTSREPTRTAPVRAAVLLVVAVLLAACAPAGAGDRDTGRVRVAAAADLQPALWQVVDALGRARPELAVEVTYGSSGTFVRQILDGAPFDLFLSADLAYPRQVVDAGLASADDVFGYGTGRLVLWVPPGSPLDPAAGPAGLARAPVRRLAVANPAHAPYGRAAVAALRTAGVLGDVQDRLVLGENAAQALEMVRSGGADAGVVPLSLVLAPALRGQGRWAEVPPGSYPPLEQGGVVLARARDAAAARVVRDALLGEDGRAVLERYGFRPPE